MVSVLVPSKEGRYTLQNGSVPETFANSNELLEHLETVTPSVLLGLMGGSGQAVFVRAGQLGWDIRRIPWHTLAEVFGDTITGASETERAAQLHAAWEEDPTAFYPAHELDRSIFLVRELTRTRLNIQEYRKMAQLQYQAAFRDLAPLLPEEGKLVQIRTTYAEPAMISGALQDEKALEAEITRQVKSLDIWRALHPGANKVLPQVKGLGPSIGGSIIGEIGDIRRFLTPEKLRAYARFHVNTSGGFPRRKRGEVANWNRYLSRAVWLWSSDQLVRYDHAWRDLYYLRKAQELRAHPEPEKRPKADGNGTATYYGLGHLDKRAKRWVGSKLLEYIFELWTAIANGQDPEVWYRGSGWPKLFEDANHALYDEGQFDWLQSQIRARRGEASEVSDNTGQAEE